MVDRHDQDILTGLDAALKIGRRPAIVDSGQAAAVAVVKLMDRTAKAIDPKALVEAYAAAAKKDGDIFVA
jgi:hypothetical protein